MPSDPLGPQQLVCVFCLLRDCHLCVGRDGDRWCEHDCYWITEGD